MKTVKGDIVALAKAGEFDVIVHGCNCFHTMGAGVALQLAKAFAGSNGPPEADRNNSAFGDRGKLGSFTVAEGRADNGKHFCIVNAYTQYDTANVDNMVPVDYKAIRSVFRLLAETLSESGSKHSRIAYPAIGAGLAGGDWDTISNIIEEELDGFDHTYVEYVGPPDPRKARKALAQRLRDACTADIYCDTSGWNTGTDDDNWIELVDRQIEDAVTAMNEAADLLDPRS